MKYLFIICFTLLSATTLAQDSISELLDRYNDNSIPYISVHELRMPKTNALLFDAREEEEFAVSHITNAILVGYNNFNMQELKNKYPDKNQQIIVYCSLGIRSETVAKKLKKAGYNNVFNLYGGIFEWKNNYYTVFNIDNNETENVHTFSKTWSKYLTNGKAYFKAEKSNIKL